MSNGRTTIHRREGSSRAFVAVGVVLVAILVTLVADRAFLVNSSAPAGTGSGVAATQSRSVATFTGVELDGANNVVVQVGARRSVVVHADANLLGRVTTRVRAGTLVIDTTPGNLNAKSPMFVEVTLPTLDSLGLAGAGNISARGIDTRHLTIAMPGSGTIEAAGTATKLTVTMSGEGTALLRQLNARDATAALGGSGTIMLTATHRLTARMSGSGTILYGGNPAQVTTSVTGTGTISAE